MSSIKLLAVVHGDDQSLIDREMDHLITIEVLPSLRDQSVIVFEGGKRRGIVKPGESAYGLLMGQLGPIMRSGIQPTLHSDDAMWRICAEMDLLADARLEDEYVTVSDAFLSFNDVPTSWNDMIIRISSDEHEVTTNGVLPEKWRAYALRRCGLFHARDKTFARQIQEHARAGKDVLFVGGVLHCVNLAARYGWGVVRKECTPEVIRDFYAHWYRSYAMQRWLT